METTPTERSDAAASGAKGIWQLRYLIPVAIFAALATFFYFGLGRDLRTLPSPLVGKPAPIFELPRLDDPTQTISNTAFAGKMYVVNVWATWCPGCRQEHAALLEIARRYQVPIIGLNWRDEREPALRWLRDLGNPYAANAFDPEGQVAIDWGVYGAPETFLIDASGNVIYKRIYPMTMQIWEEEFLPLIEAQR